MTKLKVPKQPLLVRFREPIAALRRAGQANDQIADYAIDITGSHQLPIERLELSLRERVAFDRKIGEIIKRRAEKAARIALTQTKLPMRVVEHRKSLPKTALISAAVTKRLCGCG